MDKKRSGSEFCSLPVLPAVITADRDCRFLVELNDWISAELQQVHVHNSQQYYTVYKQVFSKVHTHLQAAVGCV